MKNSIKKTDNGQESIKNKKCADGAFFYSASTTLVVEFLFNAHTSSPVPGYCGRSLPYDMVLILSGSIPSELRTCAALPARNAPSARLYSVDPRSSQ